MKGRFIVYIALVGWLGGCSVAPQKPADEYRLASMQYLQRQKNWVLEGRLALVDEKDSVSVSISWRHNELQDDIELVGPLAQGRVRISVTPGQVTVDDGENLKVFYGAVDEVLSQQLGVDLPVDSLKFWVLGVNDPRQAYIEQPGGFYQGNWLVRYKEMQTVNAGTLPKRITAEKDKARIKLIVDQWVLL
ncbi:lipoprotein insertase outer membrane protein LolB [Methylomonas rivi]|uniref:Outer-membrane lipoprotein LolB n=1 Tax=Methylomonas rivi TaxID=2952226 RepID=A0ABT1U2H9_9GAMM|nr:lipoprotein insertase outer membrane protein LolB [Methylomonas sp. WSC-6]MBS4050033.1 outer membrane lipoprotein LolB [Methylomonas sp.]MCQ8128047.1 lipoprotein insertase outer membrane protein LolB [Methylomonas sp. WSC-6]